jgi:WD40 repeat protein
VTASAFPCGTWRAQGSPDLIDVFDIDQREHRLIQSSHKGYLNNFTISHDGTLLATTAWDGMLRLWNVRTGRELEPLRGQLVRFTSAAFSPDGTRLVARMPPRFAWQCRCNQCHSKPRQSGRPGACGHARRRASAPPWLPMAYSAWASRIYAA